MSDTNHNIEYHIAGFPESWKILARAIDKYIKEYDPDYVIQQVKEKFGGMRYYFSFSDDNPDDITSVGQFEIQDRVRLFADLTMYMDD